MENPHEIQLGGTPELTPLGFIFWQPISYYHKDAYFPDAKMLKGRFLGLTTNVCNQYCYLVLTLPEKIGEQSQVLAISVVRSRYKLELAPFKFTIANGESIFYKNDSKTALESSSNAIKFNGSNPIEHYPRDSNNAFSEKLGNQLRNLMSLLRSISLQFWVLPKIPRSQNPHEAQPVDSDNPSLRVPSFHYYYFM